MAEQARLRQLREREAYGFASGVIASGVIVSDVEIGPLDTDVLMRVPLDTAPDVTGTFQHFLGGRLVHHQVAGIQHQAVGTAGATIFTMAEPPMGSALLTLAQGQELIVARLDRLERLVAELHARDGASEAPHLDQKTLDKAVAAFFERAQGNFDAEEVAEAIGISVGQAVESMDRLADAGRIRVAE
jgi:hypothetical protein